MKKVSIALAIAALALVGTASKASAAPIICPTANGPSADATYLSNGGGCNTVITFNSNGSITTTIPNAAPYDGVEDTLVGVVNNTGSPITSFNLSGSNLFGFDGDGACDGFGDYESLANCTGATDPNGYGGPGVTFSNLVGTNSGTVNFAPGIGANGGVAWFSLEEPPTLNIVVTPSVPEPTTLVLFGTGLLAVARRLRKI
jgi:hypothetical protein